MKIIFDKAHGLSAGTRTTQADFIALSNSQLEELNKVFKVHTVVDFKTVLVDYTGSVAILPQLQEL